MDDLANYGAIGILLILALTGWVVPKSREDRLIADRNRAEQQRDEVVRDVFTKVAPAIEKSIEAIKARDAHDDEIRDVLIDVRRWLESHGGRP